MASKPLRATFSKPFKKGPKVLLTIQVDTDKYTLVPKEPTPEMWGELARDIVMWDRFPVHTGLQLHKHLKSIGREIPDWLVKEIPPTDQTPPKGAVAACIYKAMLEASPCIYPSTV